MMGKHKIYTISRNINACKSEMKKAYSQILQDVLKRLDKGFKNKQRIKVAKVHRKVRNQRKDFDHKTSRTTETSVDAVSTYGAAWLRHTCVRRKLAQRFLVNAYDRVVFEKLSIQNMMQNHHLAKSITEFTPGKTESLL